MQTQNLELSNILLKEQHYLPQRNNPPFNLQLQPITHKGKIQDIQLNEIKFQNKDHNARKQRLEKAQKVRKQQLLLKIAAKNYKYELRQSAQKQNKILAEIKREQSINKIKHTQNHNHQLKMNEDNQKIPLDKVKKIYVNNQIVFSSTKGFVKNEDQMIKKMMNHKNKNKNEIKRSQCKEFKIMRVNHVKLPELNSSMGKNVNKLNNQKENQTQCPQFDVVKMKQQNEQKQLGLNPILKITDVRYFGIEQRQEDFQKIGKSLLKQIKRKYWCYDSLQNEQIFQNFQNLLNEQFM